MKLIIAIIQQQDSQKLLKVLNKHNIRSTKLSSVGGFLKKGNTTFLIGTQANRVDEVLQLIKENTKRRKKEIPLISPLGGSVEKFLERPIVGGATVFVLPMEQYGFRI